MTAPHPSSSQARQKSKRAKDRGHLFLVDLPTFAEVCRLGVDVAAAYLVLAAGTGADNRTSTWSRQAINKRTALNWRKADAAMSKLEQAGLLRWLSGKGTRKPRIDLPPIETRIPMQKHVQTVFERVEAGNQPENPKEKGAATIAERDGWLVRDEDGLLMALHDRPLIKAFLPMELIGEAFGEIDGTYTTVVERIRMSRDPLAMRLLVDLYALQNLAEHGGVDDQYLWCEFDRKKAGASGSLQIWKFTQKHKICRIQDGALSHHWREPTYEEEEEGKNGAADFFDRVQILADAGALEWVYYLTEDDEDNANRIFPVAVARHGEVIWTELESVIGGYATRAASALYEDAVNPIEFAQSWEAGGPSHFIIPADKLARKATVVGIPRLRHRARTLNASRWRKELTEDAPSMIETFRGIIVENAPELLAEADQRFADFNGDSTLSSTSLQRDINDSSQSPMHEIPPLQEGIDNVVLDDDRSCHQSEDQVDVTLGQESIGDWQDHIQALSQTMGNRG